MTNEPIGGPHSGEQDSEFMAAIPSDSSLPRIDIISTDKKLDLIQFAAMQGADLSQLSTTAIEWLKHFTPERTDRNIKIQIIKLQQKIAFYQSKIDEMDQFNLANVHGDDMVPDLGAWTKNYAEYLELLQNIQQSIEGRQELRFAKCEELKWVLFYGRPDLTGEEFSESLIVFDQWKESREDKSYNAQAHFGTNPGAIAPIMINTGARLIEEGNESIADRLISYLVVTNTKANREKQDHRYSHQRKELDSQTLYPLNEAFVLQSKKFLEQSLISGNLATTKQGEIKTRLYGSLIKEGVVSARDFYIAGVRDGHGPTSIVYAEEMLGLMRALDKDPNAYTVFIRGEFEANYDDAMSYAMRVLETYAHDKTRHSFAQNILKDVKKGQTSRISYMFDAFLETSNALSGIHRQDKSINSRIQFAEIVNDLLQRTRAKLTSDKNLVIAEQEYEDALNTEIIARIMATARNQHNLKHLDKFIQESSRTQKNLTGRSKKRRNLKGLPDPGTPK